MYIFVLNRNTEMQYKKKNTMESCNKFYKKKISQSVHIIISSVIWSETKDIHSSILKNHLCHSSCIIYTRWSNNHGSIGRQAFYVKKQVEDIKWNLFIRCLVLKEIELENLSSTVWTWLIGLDWTKVNNQ